MATPRGGVRNPNPEVVAGDEDPALRIGDAAAAAGVSTRTLRYWEELGLVTPSAHTAGGERRYRAVDLARIERVLELREVLGLNLEEIKTVIESQGRLDELRDAYRASRDVPTRASRARQRAILAEALELNETLAGQLDAKLDRIDRFRAKLAADARRCRELLDGLE